MSKKAEEVMMKKYHLWLTRTRDNIALLEVEDEAKPHPAFKTAWPQKNSIAPKGELADWLLKY